MKLCLIIFSIIVLSFSSITLAHGLSPQEIQLQQDKKKYKAYIPKNYVLFEAIQGDLNKDGLDDLVLIVKATDLQAWVDDEYKGKLDRNRRGIIILLRENSGYKKIVQNLSAFSSENEDGGVYFAPEFTIEIKNNRLNIFYGHGRYGWWEYRFRLEKNDFRLIGYESSDNHGPYIDKQVSINFLTNKKLIRNNINLDDRDKPEYFKERWVDVNFPSIFLSEIKQFDELYFDE